MGKIGLSREILRYFEGRKMEIQLYQRSWDAVKAVLRGEWQMVQPLWEAIRQFKTNNETCDYHRTQRLNFWELHSQNKRKFMSTQKPVPKCLQRLNP